VVSPDSSKEDFMQNAVYCLATNETQANEILTHLRNLGFSTSEISVLLRHQGDTRNITLKENAVRAAEKGGIVGGVLGGGVGLNALVIPGLGAFLALGPLLSAFAGAAVGSAVGGLAGGTGALGRLGLPEEIQGHVYDRLEAGDILIAVHSSDPAVRDKAYRVFRSSGADDVYYAGPLAA